MKHIKLLIFTDARVPSVVLSAITYQRPHKPFGFRNGDRSGNRLDVCAGLVTRAIQTPCVCEMTVCNAFAYIQKRRGKTTVIPWSVCPETIFSPNCAIVQKNQKVILSFYTRFENDKHSAIQASSFFRKS